MVQPRLITVNVDIFAQLNLRALSPRRHNICAVRLSIMYRLILFVPNFHSHQIFSVSTALCKMRKNMYCAKNV